MRIFLIAAAISLTLTGSALAQMCGGAQQQTSTAAQTRGMGCMGMQQAQTDDPMAEKPAGKQMSGGMCPCCKNMAMMGGMKQGGDAQPKHDMPMAPKQ